MVNNVHWREQKIIKSSRWFSRFQLNALSRSETVKAYKIQGIGRQWQMSLHGLSAKLLGEKKSECSLRTDSIIIK